MGETVNYQAEAQEADRLMATARETARHVLADTTVAVSFALVRILAPHGGHRDTRAVATGLARLRHDAQVANTLARDCSRAQIAARMLVGDALWMGYRRAALERAQAMTTEDMTVSAELTDADRSSLVGSFPILGHTVDEVAIHLVGQLRYDLDAAVTMPLTGATDPASLPVDLQQVADDHAGRVAGAVDAAYFAGVKAAVQDIGEAITGTAGGL